MSNIPPDLPPYGQQPYPPGGYPPPQQPAKKKSRLPWIIGIIAALGLCSCVGIFASLGSRGTGTTGTSTSSSQGGGAASVPATPQPAATATHAGLPTAPPKPTPTEKPTPVPKLVTTHSFSGNGIKKTETFHVDDSWKLNWSCDPSSSFGGSYNVIVTVHNKDATLFDVAVNTICKEGNTKDSTQQHAGGDVYLEINSEGSWQVQVQELRN